MICQQIKKPSGKVVGCDGAGSVWINNMLVDCPKCGGKGEMSKNPLNIPTFLPPKE